MSVEVKKAAELLKNADLSIEERNLLTTVLLEKLGALPVRARIMLDGAGRILVDGRPLTVEKARRLQMSARTLTKNFARNFVQETIKFMAIKEGVHFNLTPEQGLFAKAILWQHEEEQKLYHALAGEELGE